MKRLPVFPIKQAQQLPGPLLWHASKLWQHRLAVALKPLGLSSTNAVILSNLLHLTLENKVANQVVVAKLSGVDAMTTSNAIRVLERKGYVNRVTSSNDKRALKLQLTPLGEQTAHKALGVIARTHVQFFSPLTESERPAFIASLQKLLSNNEESK